MKGEGEALKQRDVLEGACSIERIGLLWVSWSFQGFFCYSSWGWCLTAVGIMVDVVASRKRFILVVLVAVPLLSGFGIGVRLGHNVGVETVPADSGEELGVTASTIFKEPVAAPVAHRRDSEVLALDAGDIGPFFGDVFGASVPHSIRTFTAGTSSFFASVVTILTVEHTFSTFTVSETFTVVTVETSRVGFVTGHAHPFSPTLGSEPVSFGGVVLRVLLEEFEHLVVNNAVNASINVGDIDEANVLVVNGLADRLFVELRRVLSVTLVLFIESVPGSDINVVEVALFHALVEFGFGFNVHISIVGFTFVDSVVNILVFGPGTGRSLAAGFLFVFVQELGVKGFEVFFHERSVSGLGLDEGSLGGLLGGEDINDFLRHRLRAVESHLEFAVLVGGCTNLGGASDLEVVDGVLQEETIGGGFPHGETFGVVFGIFESVPLDLLVILGEVNLPGVKGNLDIDVR